MSFTLLGLEEKVKVWGAILSPIIFMVSFIADLLSIFEKSNPIILFLLFSSSGFVLLFAIYYAIITKKISLQKEKLKKLEKEICEGNKYLLNEAMIEMDIENKKYIFEFNKEYIIISDSIKWYGCQFYANVNPTDAGKAKKHYDEYPVTWAELNIQAQLQYRNPEDTKYNTPIKVRVNQVAEGNNYKQFHIEYISTRNDPLDIKKGSQILLKYKYEIPVKKWGNYLNRYVTYWGEKTKVSIACRDEQKLRQNELKLYKTNNTGLPVLYPKGKWTDNLNNGLYIRELEIESNSLCKYVVMWNANDFFNIEGVNLNTKPGADAMQLTQY